MTALAAGIVFLLSLSAVSPALHGWLHATQKEGPAHACPHHAARAGAELPSDTPGSERDESEHGCAVTMFAHGVTHHVGALLAQPCEGILRAANYRAFERLALAQPRYLHLPPQAPPAV